MVNILIVDDTPANLSVLLNMLTQHGYKVRPAINGDIALTAVRNELPDLILLDIRMPGKDGYQVCRELKSDAATRDVPIIFISALDDIDDKVKAFQSGGVDYITKPFQLEEVLARVQTHLMLQEQRRSIQDLSDFKDEMLRIVSHDLKNPISIIQGYAELLESDLADERLRDYVANIRRSSQKMLNLVMDLLDMARAESNIPLELRQAAIEPVLAECVKSYTLPAQQRHIELVYEPPADDVVLWLDPDRFAQVINNLISNGIKYTAEGGRVTVSTAVQPNEFVIRISDNGAGVPKAALPRLFDKFYRVKTSQPTSVEGTGLGLAIAKAIVDKHHGKITVESQEGKGSTFYVTLPNS